MPPPGRIHLGTKLRSSRISRSRIPTLGLTVSMSLQPTTGRQRGCIFQVEIAYATCAKLAPNLQKIGGGLSTWTRTRFGLGAPRPRAREFSDRAPSPRVPGRDAPPHPARDLRARTEFCYHGLHLAVSVYKYTFALVGPLLQHLLKQKKRKRRRRQ